MKAVPAIPLADLYAQLRAVGAEIDHSPETLAVRFPDLHVRSTPETRRILAASGWTYTAFMADDGSGVWMDVPFAYHAPLFRIDGAL